MRSIPNLLPLSGFYKGMTQKKISRKAAKERLLSRVCVKLLLTECYNAIELFTAQLSRASNRLHARPPEQL